MRTTREGRAAEPAASAARTKGSSAPEGPIFIGGLDRSGKTTLRAFLASHPRIAIPAVGSNMETYFYGRFGDLAEGRNLDRCLDAMLRYKHVRFLDPDRARIRREFLDGSPSYERLFSLFLIHFAESEGKPRWGAQTGLIERYADVLFAAHPDAKVIHMVRDPRDRYEASLARWPDGRGRAGGATARWLYSTRLAERNLRRYPGSYLVVRFEDLVCHPERVLRRVCRFVGETYSPDLLEMPGAPKHRALLLEGGPANGPTPLSASHIGRARSTIARQEIAFIQLHAASRMRAYGYEVASLRLSAKEMVRFATLEWPDQLARMLAWYGVEAMQQRYPAIVPRRPDPRMTRPAAEQERV